MAGLKSFDDAAITIAGIDLAHRVRKNRFSFGRGRRRRGGSRQAEWAIAPARTTGSKHQTAAARASDPRMHRRPQPPGRPNLLRTAAPHHGSSRPNRRNSPPLRRSARTRPPPPGRGHHTLRERGLCDHGKVRLHHRKLPVSLAGSQVCHWRQSAFSAHNPALPKARPGFDRNISAVIAFFPPTMISHVFDPTDRLTPMWRGAVLTRETPCPRDSISPNSA